jgi:tetratricopeptide (TPR) repeat protein
MSRVARRHHARGVGALARGDVDGAVEALAAAVEVAPSVASARVAYAIALGRAGDHPRAGQILRAGLARPTTPAGRAALWATLGDVLTAMGDWPGALDAFAQARATPGFEARAASGEARVHAKTGRYREAFAALAVAARG